MPDLVRYRAVPRHFFRIGVRFPKDFNKGVRAFSPQARHPSRSANHSRVPDGDVHRVLPRVRAPCLWYNPRESNGRRLGYEH